MAPFLFTVAGRRSVDRAAAVAAGVVHRAVLLLLHRGLPRARDSGSTGRPVGAQYRQVEGQLSAAMQGAVDFQRYDDPGTAIAAVQDGKLVAALVYPDAGGGPVRLYIASAHQFQTAQLITGILTPVFAAQDVDLEKRDVAPLPANDSFGMTALYLMLAWCIGGYMVAMFIGMLGAPLLHRTKSGS